MIESKFDMLIGVNFRYYTVETGKSLLENLRNRVIVNHPTLVVCLDTEADQYEILSEEEAQKIREIERQKRQIVSFTDFSIPFWQNKNV